MVTKSVRNQNEFNIFLNQYFNIILAALVVILLAASYFVVLRPKYNDTLMAIQNNIADQKRLYAQEQRKLASLKTMAELYKKISPTDLNKFNGILPNSYAPERLFGEIEEIVSAQGFLVQGITVSSQGAVTAPSTPMNVGQINLNVSLGAIDYSGLKILLKTLETNLRLFDITSVGFSPGGNTASLVLSTYYYQK